MSNKFNSFGFGKGGGDPTNGTLDLWGKSLTATNLQPSSAVITDANSKLATTSLATSSPQGLDGQIQFKDGSFFAGNVSLSFDKATNTVTLNVFTILSSGEIQLSGDPFIHQRGGANNFSSGLRALSSVTTGQSITCVGVDAGAAITTAISCSFFGNNAGLKIKTGSNTLAIGVNTLRESASASNTIAIGANAGINLTDGVFNILIGIAAGSSYTGNESQNICISSIGFDGDNFTIRIGSSIHTRMFIEGIHSRSPANSATQLVFVDLAGQAGSNAALAFDQATSILTLQALDILSNGEIQLDGDTLIHTRGLANNFATGPRALASVTTGQSNTANGVDALKALLTAVGMVFMGQESGLLLESGSGCVAIGFQALSNCVSSTNVTAVGHLAGATQTGGSNNGFYGTGTGSEYKSTESFNILIHSPGVTGDNNTLRIGDPVVTQRGFIHGIYGVAPSGTGIKMVVQDGGGQMGTFALPLSLGGVEGFLITNTTSSTKTISEGVALDSTNDVNLITSGSLVLDISTSGANGLDTGSHGEDLWYAIFIIADTTGASSVASLCSLSATAPTLPGTYDMFRRIGWMYNKANLGSPNLASAVTSSRSRDRFYIWGEDHPYNRALFGGSATTYTNVDLSQWVPPTSTLAYLQVSHNTTGSGGFVSLRPDGASARSYRVFAGDAGSTHVSSTFHLDTDSSQVIEYQNETSGEETTIWVLGYTDSI